LGVTLTRRACLSLAAAPLFAAPGKPRVGCQTRAYGSPIPDKAKLLAVLEDLKAAGYDGFETNFKSLEHSFDDPAPMRKEIEARGVPLIGLHMGAGLFEPDKIEAERAQVLRVARGSQALGGGHVIVSGRQLPTGPDGLVKEGALAAKAREAERLGAELRAIGVRLSIHNHTHEVAHDAAELRRFLELTTAKNVGLLFDVGHVLHNEVDVAAFVREHGPRITGLHVRDVKDGDEALMGAGVVDFKALGDAVRKIHWTGWVIVEVNPRQDVSSRELVNRARGHLRKTMGV
jgi:sugar phosphate isomerase/epimerase